MIINKLMFIGVPNLEDHYRRPFRLGSSNDMLDALENAIEDTSVGSIRPSALCNVMERGMSYSADDREDARIVGGWGRHRYRFILEIEIAPIGRHGTSGERVLVVGYTEASDRSIDGTNIPATMEMFVNGVVGLRDTEVREGGRTFVETTIIKPFQVLRGSDARGNRDYLSRPTEVFKTMQLEKTYGRNAETYDTRNVFNGKARTSSVNNDIRGAYLSKLIRADYDGYYSANEYEESQFASSREAASADALNEPQINNNDFLRAISSANRNYTATASFYYEDLIPFTDHRDLEDLDDLTQVSPLTGNDFDYDSIRWNGGDMATVAAFTIARELPALMIDVLMSSCTITINNDRLDGDMPQWDIPDWTMYVDIASSDKIAETLTLRFIDRIIRPLTRDNRLRIDVIIEASTEGMVKIDMSWDGGRFEVFNYPAFCAGVVSSNYTGRLDNLRKLTDSYSDIRKYVIDPAIFREADLD